MKLEKIDCKFLRYSKGFCFSEHYAVFCTGRTAFICNRKLECLHQVDNLFYVYKAKISPDENNVLLISNSHHFYILNLKDFSLIKHVIRGKHNGNLEGRGCFSVDGKSIYLPLFNPKTFLSVLRRYDLASLSSFEDFMDQEYMILSIQCVRSLNKYLMLVLDRTSNPEFHIYKIVWFDGRDFEIYRLYIEANRAEYDSDTGKIMLYDFFDTYRCDVDGKNLKLIDNPEDVNIVSSFSDAFKNLPIEKDKFDYIKNLSAAFGMENISIRDSINKVVKSLDGNKNYVITNTGIYICGNDGKVLDKKRVQYGVQDVFELSPDLILIETWGGVKAFKIDV